MPVSVSKEIVYLNVLIYYKTGINTKVILSFKLVEKVLTKKSEILFMKIKKSLHLWELLIQNLEQWLT